MEDKKIIFLAAPGDSTNILYNAVNSWFPVHKVILEGKEERSVFIKRRVKKYGWIHLTGQVLFQLIVVKILNIFSGKRRKNIITENKLNLGSIEKSKVVEVDSVNDGVVLEILAELNPAVIVINGTRIISKKMLASVKCPIVNTHAGITPMYRGVHGAYWALVNDDAANCGVTVHLVDAGIDTGAILYQSKIEVGKQDNFVTYPYLQTAKAVALLKQAVADALENRIVPVTVKGRSVLWSHPTIWQYLYYRIFKNVK